MMAVSEASTTSSSALTVEMLDLFESVGAQRSAVTCISLATYGPRGADPYGERIGGGEYREDVKPRSIAVLRECLPKKIASCDQREESVILSHPRGGGVDFVQLDDVAVPVWEVLAPLSFLGLDTNGGRAPGQLWFALPSEGEESDRAFKSRLKELIRAKYPDLSKPVDVSATGATRCAGSRNFKQHYGPDHPLILISHAAPGRRTTRAELAMALGVDLADEPRPFPAPLPAYSSVSSGPCEGRWPDYAKSHQGTSDASGSDYAWCCLAFGWGWGYSVEDVAAELRRLIPDARLRRKAKNYCLNTAISAFEKGKWDRSGSARFILAREARRASQDAPKVQTLPSVPPTRQRRFSGPQRPSERVSGSPVTGRAPSAATQSAPPAPYVPPAPTASAMVPPGAGGYRASGVTPSGVTPFFGVRRPKVKVLAITETPADALAITEASGLLAISVGGGIPQDLRVRCGLAKALLFVGDEDAKRLEIILWGKPVRVKVPSGYRSVSDMDADALRSLIMDLAPEAFSAPPRELSPTSESPPRGISLTLSSSTPTSESVVPVSEAVSEAVQETLAFVTGLSNAPVPVIAPPAVVEDSSPEAAPASADPPTATEPEVVAEPPSLEPPEAEAEQALIEPEVAEEHGEAEAPPRGSACFSESCPTSQADQGAAPAAPVLVPVESEVAVEPPAEEPPPWAVAPVLVEAESLEPEDLTGVLDYAERTLLSRCVLDSWLWYGHQVGCKPDTWPDKWTGLGRCSTCKSTIQATREQTALVRFQKHVIAEHSAPLEVPVLVEVVRSDSPYCECVNKYHSHREANHLQGCCCVCCYCFGCRKYRQPPPVPVEPDEIGYGVGFYGNAA